MLDQGIHIRFWPKVNFTKSCWEWNASKDVKGYGMFRPVFGRSMEHAHRTSWKLVNGNIPVDMMVLHICDNPACVRPDHLWLGNNQDNMTDMVSKNRSKGAAGEKNSHAKLSVDNVREIRMLVSKQHRSYANIAKIFGITPTQARKVSTGKAWSHV